MIAERAKLAALKELQRKKLALRKEKARVYQASYYLARTLPRRVAARAALQSKECI